MGCVRRYLEIMSHVASVFFWLSLWFEELAPLFWATSSPLQYQVSASGLSESSESSSPWCDWFLRCFSFNPPRYTSFCRTWEVDAASNESGSILILLSDFPEAIGIPGLLDATGLDVVEELVAVKEDRFIAAGRDLDTTLSSSFWSCILFAIVEHLIKVKFLVQQEKLKWLKLSKWRRLFHSSRVKFPSVKMSASWCLVSM